MKQKFNNAALPNDMITNLIKILKQKFNNLISDKRFSKILTGSIWALSGQIIKACASLIVSIIIARYYGADAMGILAVITSYLTLTTIFTVLGTNVSILRFIPEHITKYSHTSAFRVYRKIQYFVIGISIFMGCLFFMSSEMISDRIFSKPQLSFYFTLASMFIIFKSMMLLNNQAVRGLKLVKVFAFLQVLPNILNLILLIVLTFFLYAQANPVYTYLGSILMTAFAGWVIMNYFFKIKMQPQDLVQNIPMVSILRVSSPMLMTAAMNFVIAQTGVIMLGMFRTEAEVGYYYVAVKLATLTVFILHAINSMAAPKFSELYHSGKMDELFHIAKKSTKLIFYATVPILLILIIFGLPIITILFGKDFTIAYSAMIFLIIGQFVNSISGSTAFFMNMTGNEKVFRNIVFIAAIGNIILNSLLIPLFGINGAAVAGMLSMAGWNIATLIFVKRKFGRSIGYFPNFRIWGL